MFEVGSGPTVVLGTLRAILVNIFRIWDNKLLLLPGDVVNFETLGQQTTITMYLVNFFRIWDNKLQQLPGEPPEQDEQEHSEPEPMVPTQP